MSVNFATSAADNALINAIVARAKPVDAVGLHMDLTAVHANGCPMDFARMLAADDFNFWHDLCGIQWHLDRKTGRLGHFLPRCSLRRG